MRCGCQWFDGGIVLGKQFGTNRVEMETFLRQLVYSGISKENIYIGIDINY